MERASFDRVFGTELFDARAGYLRISFLPGRSDADDHVPTYAELPEFAPPKSSLRADLRDAVAPFGILAVEGLLFLGLATIAVVRMEA